VVGDVSGRARAGGTLDVRRGRRPPRVRCLAAALTTIWAGACLTGCSSSSSGTTSTADGTKVISAVATISAWGSILAQLGGTHVRTTSIISNPNTDPHDYEPTPADARTIATAQVFVENGIGYDPWATRALAANPDSGRTVIDVGDVVGIKAGGNPHQWYSPKSVETVAIAIATALKKIDPTDAAYFDARQRTFLTNGLATYHQLISAIRSRYSGTPVGASESIFAPLGDALGLHLATPASFLKAITEGTDPSAADKATIDAQIKRHQIKVYVFNSQNSTPDVAAQVKAARAAGIPVTAVTETLAPATASFQDWQVAELRALATALHQATGK
jgi:zinc/manganese transport system substrate-binding protein